jgi:hypothetical protein
VDQIGERVDLPPDHAIFEDEEIFEVVTAEGLGIDVDASAKRDAVLADAFECRAKPGDFLTTSEVEALKSLGEGCSARHRSNSSSARRQRMSASAPVNSPLQRAR